MDVCTRSMLNCHEDLLTPPTAMPKINHAMRHGYVLNVNEEMFSTLVVTVTVPHIYGRVSSLQYGTQPTNCAVD